MIHLRAIDLPASAADVASQYPFSTPAIRSLRSISFERPVTFLVGENGSGKSTLIEALAWAAQMVAAGSEAIDLDTSLGHVRPLGEALRLTWNRRSRRGFFLRAEDFFGYVKRTQTELAELRREVDRVVADSFGLPEAEVARRAAPFTKSIAELERRYGNDPDARSHGEQFLNFFQARLAPNGFYLLDEPEAPLSPMRQLALLAIIRKAVAEQECQFIVSTHSPLLMALPEADILSFDADSIQAVGFDDLEHVSLVRDFLNRPESFLRHL